MNQGIWFASVPDKSLFVYFLVQESHVLFGHPLQLRLLLDLPGAAVRVGVIQTFT